MLFDTGNDLNLQSLYTFTISRKFDNPRFHCIYTSFSTPKSKVNCSLNMRLTLANCARQVHELTIKYSNLPERYIKRAMEQVSEDIREFRMSG